MRSSVICLLTFLTAVVNAHFQFGFPPPRGAFVASKEVEFCGGYSSPAANRTQFPLSGGYVTIKFSHGDNWTAKIYVSTSQNPTTMADFALNGGGSGTKPGNYCFPVDLSHSNVSAGQNITIQFEWSGGDGNLYQCADLTLASDLNLSSTVPCQNVTATVTSSSGSPAKTSIATANIAKPITFLTALVALAGLLLL